MEVPTSASGVNSSRRRPLRHQDNNNNNSAAPLIPPPFPHRGPPSHSPSVHHAETHQSKRKWSPRWSSTTAAAAAAAATTGRGGGGGGKSSINHQHSTKRKNTATRILRILQRGEHHYDSERQTFRLDGRVAFCVVLLLLQFLWTIHMYGILSSSSSSSSSETRMVEAGIVQQQQDDRRQQRSYGRKQFAFFNDGSKLNHNNPSLTAPGQMLDKYYPEEQQQQQQQQQQQDLAKKNQLAAAPAAAAAPRRSNVQQILLYHPKSTIFHSESSGVLGGSSAMTSLRGRRAETLFSSILYRDENTNEQQQREDVVRFRVTFATKASISNNGGSSNNSIIRRPTPIDSLFLLHKDSENDGVVDPKMKRNTGSFGRSSGDSEDEGALIWMPHSQDYGGLQIVPLWPSTAGTVGAGHGDSLFAPAIHRAIRVEEEQRDHENERSDRNNNSNNNNNKEKEDEREQQHYYAFDDDWVRGQAGLFDDEDVPKKKEEKEPQDEGGRGGADGNRNNKDDSQLLQHHECRRIQEHRLAFPTCNEFHQLDYTGDAGGSHALTDSDFRFINKGAFREVFSYTHQYYGRRRRQTDENEEENFYHEEKVAIKEIDYADINPRRNKDSDMESFEYVRMDAIVAERLTASPRVYDIYGHCGLSILSEFFYHGDLESRAIGGDRKGRIKAKDLHDKEAVDPQNNLTAAQKLVLALDMAEGLADLHGYDHGLIIHDDLQLSQFLLNGDRTRLKLNDFNRAEFPLWDEEHQQYCKYKNGRGHGNWRSPEEYKDEPLTEAIDIWAFGNSLVGLLIGLSPNYELDEATGIQITKTSKRVIGGDMPTFVDPRYSERSPEEGVLVQIIKRCFAYAPEDRPTIFEIVQELQQAVSDLLESTSKQGVSRQSILQQL